MRANSCLEVAPVPQDLSEQTRQLMSRLSTPQLREIVGGETAGEYTPEARAIAREVLAERGIASVASSTGARVRVDSSGEGEPVIPTAPLSAWHTFRIPTYRELRAQQDAEYKREGRGGFNVGWATVALIVFWLIWFLARLPRAR
jgi:hypothetical protein